MILRPGEWTGHVFVAGQTGSGKSYAAVRWALSWSTVAPVIVLDPADQGLPFTRADRHDEWSDILAAAAAGGVAYVPHDDPRYAAAELQLIAGRLMRRGEGEPPALLVVDEAQEYAPEGRVGPLHRIALRGRRRPGSAGVQLVAISPRPAQVAKAIVSQCRYHVIFSTSSFEDEYMRRHGLPADEIRAALAAAPDYSYALLDNGRLLGIRREDA